MRRLVLATLLLLFSAAGAEAGFLDRLQQRIENNVDSRINDATRKVENKINTTVDEGIDQVVDPRAQPNSKQQPPTPKKKSSGFAQPDPAETKITYEFKGSQNVPGDWNVAPEGSVQVREVDIKGVRLGMPEVLVKETLEKAGFEQQSLYQFQKEVRLIEGMEKEVTRSDRKGRSAESLGPLVKKYIINVKTIHPSNELLQNMEEPLRGMIAKARARVGDRPLSIVYHIEYIQYFGDQTKRDPDAIKGQIQSFFGTPTYQPMSIHRRLGSAYGTDESRWLIYHDSAHIPIQLRKRLMDLVKDKSAAKMLKDAFQHPCGARSTQNCVNAGLTVAFPDNLDHRLQAAMIAYSPVMMVDFQGKKITTLMEWGFLRSEKGIRDYFAKTKAHQAKPVATIDF